MLGRATLTVLAEADYQKRAGPVWFAGAFCATAVVPTLALLVLDPRILDGEPLWLKPLKFQISLAILCFTLAAAMLKLPAAWRLGRWARWSCSAVCIAALYEVVFLAIQAARGKRSHFNSETLFDQLGGAAMAMGAYVLIGGTVVVGMVSLAAWASRRSAPSHSTLTLSLGLGLCLGGVLAGYTGSVLGMNGGPIVGLVAPTDSGLPLLGWVLTAGDLRIAHFLGLHAMQAIPLVALVLMRITTRSIATALVAGSGGVWVWLTVSSLNAAREAQVPFWLQWTR